MYRYASLPGNLAHFCVVLRREYGFHLSAGELADAARALTVIDIADESAARDALRVVLCGTADDVAVFDRAFNSFFYPEPMGEPQNQPPLGRRVHLAPESNSPERPGGDRTDTIDDEGDEDPGDAAAVPTPLDESDAPLEDVSLPARARYSPIAVDHADRPSRPEIDTAWLSAARRLVRRVELGLSRRWRPARAGRRFDARRTLRVSLQFGGEPISPRWRRRARRSPRFVVIVDGSRSMEAYAETSLRIAAALASVTRRVEVFTFSTALQCVTNDVRRDSGATRRRRPWNEHAWGGGTNAGACLGAFARQFGGALLGPDTLVVVSSDGLDVGAPDLLRTAMQVLRRRSAGVIWLNPLLETPGYAPTARGMRVALPYVTTFASANDLAGFAGLARTIRVRG
jgi:uncharacterized protein with von Willebrand factor type A (vWA) domain